MRNCELAYKGCVSCLTRPTDNLGTPLSRLLARSNPIAPVAGRDQSQLHPIVRPFPATTRASAGGDPAAGLLGPHAGPITPAARPARHDARRCGRGTFQRAPRPGPCDRCPLATAEQPCYVESGGRLSGCAPEPTRNQAVAPLGNAALPGDLSVRAPVGAESGHTEPGAPP